MRTIRDGSVVILFNRILWWAGDRFSAFAVGVLFGYYLTHGIDKLPAIKLGSRSTSDGDVSLTHKTCKYLWRLVCSDEPIYLFKIRRLKIQILNAVENFKGVSFIGARTSANHKCDNRTAPPQILSYWWMHWNLFDLAWLASASTTSYWRSHPIQLAHNQYVPSHSPLEKL